MTRLSVANRPDADNPGGKVYGTLDLSGGTLSAGLSSDVSSALLVVSGALTVSGNVNPAPVDGYTPRGEWLIAQSPNVDVSQAILPEGYRLRVQGSSVYLPKPPAGTLLTIR